MRKRLRYLLFIDAANSRREHAVSRIQLMGDEEMVFTTGVVSAQGTTRESLIEWAQRKAKRFGECRILGRQGVLAVASADGTIRITN